MALNPVRAHTEQISPNGLISGLVNDESVVYLGSQDDNRISSQIASAEGRHFVAVGTEVDVSIGAIVQSKAPSAVIANLVTASTATIGDKEIEIEVAGVARNQYQFGYLHVVGGIGVGQTYVIKANTVSDSSDKVLFTIEGGLVIALDATSDVQLQEHVNIVELGDGTSAPKGVAVRASTAAADSNTQVVFAQVSGNAVVRVETATSIAAGTLVASGAAGGVVIADGILPTIGLALASPVSGFVLVNLDMQK